MNQIEREIAELSNMLPLFIGTLLDGCETNIPIKLNLTEERTLLNIQRRPGDPMHKYSRKAGLSKGAFTSVADSLQRKGLIERVPMQDDRRKSGLVLTEQGKATTKKIQSDFNKFIEQKISHMQNADKEALRDALRTIVASIEWLEQKESDPNEQTTTSNG
jgi:DNA-binding MarR family transcriptional regulator